MTTQTPTNAAHRSGFVSIIGRPNVGKSTLLNHILGQKIAITSSKPQTTRNRILGIHSTKEAQVLFLDTPGIHQAKGELNQYMVDLALSACSGVDQVLLLVDAKEPPFSQEDRILKLLKTLRVPVSLVINKIDLVAKPNLLKLIQGYTDRFDFAHVYPISALKGQGVEPLLQTLEQALPEGPSYYPEEMITDLPERFIAAEMIREKVMRRTRDEIPYGVAVTVDRFDEREEKELIVLNATIHVERDSHKRIIVGKKGAMIKAIGQDARRDIERFLGARVFLELFVKIQKDWTRSQRLMREMGYE